MLISCLGGVTRHRPAGQQDPLSQSPQRSPQPWGPDSEAFLSGSVGFSWVEREAVRRRAGGGWPGCTAEVLGKNLTPGSLTPGHTKGQPERPSLATVEAAVGAVPISQPDWRPAAEQAGCSPLPAAPSL